MFPLGSVLFPTMVLPLHVFEPRYRALARDVIGGDGRFGVVLIERGSEVGGEDVRTDLGTIAEVVESEELDDGRWALTAVGRERIRVVNWLADDPYPRADVAPLVDERTSDDDIDLDPLLARLRRALALQAELGEARAPVDVELNPDPAIATLQMGAIGPFGPVDQQRLLATTDPDRRLVLVDELLRDATELIEHRLAGT
jgi:Lon protease-like protein